MNKTDCVSFWRNRRVPRRYVKMFVFIETYRRTHNMLCPTWAEIATHMGWEDWSRNDIRKVMRKGQQFGLKFDLNKPRTTRVNGRVVPHIEDRLPDMVVAA